MNVKRWQLFKRLKPLEGCYSVVKPCVFEGTCILLELPFQAELNGLCPYAIIICKLLSYYYMCVIFITVVISTKVMHYFICYLAF